MPPRLFLDANVLYPALLRDLLLRLAVEGVCQVHWSAEVQREWKRHLVDDAGYPEDVITRTQMRMNAAFPNAQISGYEERTVHLQLPDPADRHVLAAAIQAGASSLVTFNLKDFPVEVLAQYGLAALHPDVLMARLWAASPDGCLRARAKLVASLRAPPISAGEIALSLENLQMPQSARLFRGDAGL